MQPISSHSQIQLIDIDLTPIYGLVNVVRMRTADVPTLIAAAHAQTDLANTCMQMFYVLLALDQTEFALDMQARAIQQSCLYRMVGPVVPAIRMLALMGPGDMSDNTPFEFVLENSDIRLDLCFLTANGDLPSAVPDHDVAIVAIGESDKNRPLLTRVKSLLATWPRPVLNTPDFILRGARDTAYKLLHDIPGLYMPKTSRLKREESYGQKSIASGVHPEAHLFPITIRPIDTQGGNGLEKVDTQAALNNYLHHSPATEHYVAQYVDYQSEDGLFRKIRIALIDQKPYICHVAISEHWMVHYRSAGMEESAQKRAEEAAFMTTFDTDFAVQHHVALTSIAGRLGLDFCVLDCAQTRDGRLLLFEADSRGWIHATDDIETYPYKAAVMQKAFNAFRAMLVKAYTLD